MEREFVNYFMMKLTDPKFWCQYYIDLVRKFKFQAFQDILQP